MADFLELCDRIETLDLPKSASRKAYSGIKEDGLFMNIATVLKCAADNEMYDMVSRAAYDKVDHIIALNKPIENGWREHVVPCTMITQEAYRMFDEDNATVAQVAVMIQSNLFIVHITKEEQQRVDVELGLKTAMPDGWEFGDDVFARLDAAQIKY